MPNPIIGLQGGRAIGSEATFDGQQMQAGVHLRWSFSPELGFPPGGFRLCRRVARRGSDKIPLPAHLQAALTQGIVIEAGALVDEWHAELHPPGEGLILLGAASACRPRLCIETFGRDHAGRYFESGARTVEIAGPRFRAHIEGDRIARLCVAGASSLEVQRLSSILQP